ncbi:MAG: HD domain-containing protein [Planctomycetota bacterium]|jgi:(p)ppGpp synthase/HD superfamily hydrolase|nr:HD domain-containing protein [Planctomycetota bacterium]MDP6989398.1 HD domain-containing protein [Planctomycetota bacterium]
MGFSEDVERALREACEAHAGQSRKDGRTPYFLHPVHVALILARWGADEETLLAGILHDVVEDCEEWTDARLREEFGDAVAGIVAEVTEDKSIESWAERKRLAVAHVATMSERAILVKAADKLHNMRSLATHLRDRPRDVWGAFNGGREGTLRVAGELVGALTARLGKERGAPLIEALGQLEAEA